MAVLVGGEKLGEIDAGSFARRCGLEMGIGGREEERVLGDAVKVAAGGSPRFPIELGVIRPFADEGGGIGGPWIVVVDGGALSGQTIHGDVSLRHPRENIIFDGGIRRVIEQNRGVRAPGGAADGVVCDEVAAASCGVTVDHDERAKSGLIWRIRTAGDVVVNERAGGGLLDKNVGGHAARIRERAGEFTVEEIVVNFEIGNVLGVVGAAPDVDAVAVHPVADF